MLDHFAQDCLVLYQEIYTWQKSQETLKEGQKNSELPLKLKEKTLSLLGRLILALMEQRDNFYGFFLLQMERKIDLAYPGPTGTAFREGRFVLLLNPLEFLPLEKEQMFATLEHEVLHLVSLHWQRAKALQKAYSKIAVNIAMDVAVNNYLTFLPPSALDLAWVNRQYGLLLKPFETLEYYAQEVQKALEEKARDPRQKTSLAHQEQLTGLNPATTHDSWEHSDDVDTELLGHFVEQYVDRATKGMLTGQLAKAVANLKKQIHEVPWNWYLKKIVGHVATHYKPTTTRRNRRQPERLELRGALKKHEPKIGVALDMSGSISEGEFKQAMNEVLSLVQLYKQELTVIECDNAIRRVYKARTSRDLNPRLAQRSGTAYSPVIALANKEKFDLLVYFTDGKGEERLTEEPKGYKILWVLSGDGDQLSLAKSQGLVKRLRPIQEEDHTLDYYDVEHGGFSMNAQEHSTL